MTIPDQDNSVILELASVDKHYLSPYQIDGADNQIRVLESINLKVKTGETVSITGPSGSGKSTLLNICGTLDVPSSGEVVLDGSQVSGLSEKQIEVLRKNKIGFIFQQHHLLPQLSTLENVLLPALAESSKVDSAVIERGVNLLKIAGLSKRLDHKPGELSGGECQRTAVVRSLINRPAIILADEPTGSLDQKTSKTITELLLEFQSSENLTLLVVTHASDLAQKMETQYVLEDFCLRHESNAGQ